MVLYELKKLKTQKTAWLFIFICIVGAVVLMTRTDSFSEQLFMSRNNEVTEAYLNVFADMDIKDIPEYIKAERDRLSQESRTNGYDSVRGTAQLVP